jgi:hypothetical protein
MQTGLGSDRAAGQFREALDKRDRANPAPQQNANPHLRSGNTVMRYHVHATDGDIGHVQGILIDERTWAIHYLIVNTSNWWLGHDVLIAPEWITGVDWIESKVSVDVTRQSVKDAPHYDPAVSLDGEQSARVHRHYGRDGYRREAGYEPVIPHLGP